VTTPDESTDTARLAAVLAEHRERADNRYSHGGRWACSCGASGMQSVNSHLAHVAAVLVEAGVGFVAQAKAEEREAWAAWLENWIGAVGPERPTLEAVVAWLRADSRPFGARAAREDAR
jgi:hypothetical protein